MHFFVAQMMLRRGGFRGFQGFQIGFRRCPDDVSHKRFSWFSDRIENGAEVCKSCRFRQELSNGRLLDICELHEKSASIQPRSGLSKFAKKILVAKT